MRSLHLPNRTLISCLLLSAIIPILISSPTVNSQSLTTVTSFQTITISYTSSATSTSLQPVQYVHYPNDYDRNTNAFHLSNARTRVVVVFAPGEFQEIPCGSYDYFTFTAVTSEEIRGQLTADPYPVNFYIIPKAQFDKWENSAYRMCGQPGAVLVNGTGFSYSFDWIVPTNGEYVLLFDTRFHGGTGPNSITVHFSADVVSSSIVANTATSTLTQAIASTSTVVSSSTSMIQPAETVPIQFILLPVAVILAAVFLVWTVRRRPRK